MTTQPARMVENSTRPIVDAKLEAMAEKWVASAGTPARVHAAEKLAEETADLLKKALDVNPELLRKPVTL